MNAPTSFRLSETALKLLDRLSSLLGLKRSAVMELALRELAKKHKVQE
jgi:predicted transcriptional regulator